MRLAAAAACALLATIARGGEAYPHLLARAVTAYDATDVSRSWNVALAASRLDGAVVPAGAPLSLNDRGGPRDRPHGFRVAPEIVGGEKLDGIGGGTCQVSSTLYSAALDAGLDVRARIPHSRPAPYLPPGRDATTSWEKSLDLRLANPLDQPVLVRAHAADGRLVVELRTERDPQREVRVTQERRPGEGDYAGGLVVVTMRVVRAADGSEEREIISTDHYVAPRR